MKCSMLDIIANDCAIAFLLTEIKRFMIDTDYKVLAINGEPILIKYYSKKLKRYILCVADATKEIKNG